jgi:hypothetical protein
MTYAKPQLVCAGVALKSIRGQGAKGLLYADTAPLPSGLNTNVSAYESDE